MAGSNINWRKESLHWRLSMIMKKRLPLTCCAVYKYSAEKITQKGTPSVKHREVQANCAAMWVVQSKLKSEDYADITHQTQRREVVQHGRKSLLSWPSMKIPPFPGSCEQRWLDRNLLSCRTQDSHLSLGSMPNAALAYLRV